MTLKQLALATTAALGLAVAAPAAQADTVQLGFILDRSGSIGFTDYGIITTGLGNAINLIPIGGANTYEVSIVTFAGSANALVQNLVIDDAGDKAAIIAALNADAAAYTTGGSTNYDAGFSLMRTVLKQNASYATLAQYVNFATDGDPNPNSADGLVPRQGMIDDGFENISIEGIGVTAGTAAFLQNSICYPGPCDTTSPFSFPTTGFYIGVSDAQGYADAIGNKILTVTNQVPEPATIAVLGMGLLGLAFARRRRSA